MTKVTFKRGQDGFRNDSVGAHSACLCSRSIQRIFGFTSQKKTVTLTVATKWFPGSKKFTTFAGEYVQRGKAHHYLSFGARVMLAHILTGYVSERHCLPDRRTFFVAAK